MMGVCAFERGLDGVEFAVHGRTPVFPFTQHFQTHEVLSQDRAYQHSVLFGHNFFGGTAFFLDEQRGVAIC